MFRQKSSGPTHQMQYPMGWEWIPEKFAQDVSAAGCIDKNRHWWHAQARKGFQRWYAETPLHPYRLRRKDLWYRYYGHDGGDGKSRRLNSSHVAISDAVFI